MKTTTKKATVLATVLASKNDWLDTRLTCQYKGVEMTAKLYDIKIMLEKRAKQALVACHSTLKAIPSKVSCNNDFISLFASGKLSENTYKNSLTVQVVDKNTSVLYQTGLHFILAARVDGQIFVNTFAFGNRTVTERERFAKQKIKFIPFVDGTVKAATLEKTLYACETREQAAAVQFEYPRPNIAKGIKVYLAKCIASAKK